MHVEKRKAGKSIEYYLAHSYREGDKVHKYKIISDPLQVELSKEEIHSIKELEKQIPVIRHLSDKDWKQFSEIFTYNTNAIEGSKLNIKEVRDLLEKDKWPDRSKEDIAEAFGVDRSE